MGTLIALRICGATNTSDYLYPANNKSETIVTIVKVSNNKTQETLPASNYYQGIKLSREELKSLLKESFTSYGIADELPQAEAVVLCESGWNMHASNGISFGIAQFTPATWKEFGYGDIFNPQSQFQTMAKMWKNSLLRLRWDCYRMIK